MLEVDFSVIVLLPLSLWIWKHMKHHLELAHFGMGETVVRALCAWCPPPAPGTLFGANRSCAKGPRRLTGGARSSVSVCESLLGRSAWGGWPGVASCGCDARTCRGSKAPRGLHGGRGRFAGLSGAHRPLAFWVGAALRLTRVKVVAFDVRWPDRQWSKTFLVGGLALAEWPFEHGHASV